MSVEKVEAERGIQRIWNFKRKESSAHGVFSAFGSSFTLILR